MARQRDRVGTMTALIEPITVRAAYADDETALMRLAALDSAPVPAAPLLVAEVAGELRAALSLTDGTTIADPFHYTALHLELLRARAAMQRRPRQRGGHLREGHRLRLA
ncbi:MAG: hypothetical protein QOG59_1737 [Solirubrobacteraceae bacterium]|jgi:hypothetical protein|nr:hypothetical protein [Solirubrobacteraceae bacterium]